MMICGIEHVGLMSKDPQSLAEWYERVLDFRIIFRTEPEALKIFITGKREGMIEIIPYGNGINGLKPHERQVMHLAISVDDFEEAHQRLKTEAVDICGEPLDIFSGGKVLFFKDPEGNLLHLVYRPVKPWTAL